ncbi:hypothetical protein RXV94_09180 [Yeosuana sp. MJ-SS3]|uniref:Uncharacterized protein n=1 Tax=Gilvirhabdus luticola TaxID=3079858 RepID=A0ABU3U7P6_9FLAO|nr:hypothetical protein [Yeosuana sp. MJ-SS3]MDU8886331.1 hypothetical protein [Yeosuana sp. MJ-SS3]
MYKNVVIKAFEKGKNEIPGNSSKTNISNHISDVLLNDYKYPLSARSLRNLFDASKTCDEATDINISSDHTKILCQYLGYKSYSDFLIENPDKIKSEKNKGAGGFLKKNKLTILISVITIIVIYFITSINKQRWMIWQEDHYVEVSFDAEKYSMSQMKLYNKDRINDFRKIRVNCETEFFNSTGEVKIWYGKNSNGELEYFTAFGLHPETGKTLKEITTYMIKTHICGSY